MPACGHGRAVPWLTWYISLEDIQGHLHRRLGTITDEEPDNLFFTTEENRIGIMADTLEKHTHNFVKQRPDTKLIVIDTFQLVRGNSKEPSLPVTVGHSEV